MIYINGYLKTLVIMIILKPIFINLVSEEKSKKYIDFVFGLIIISLLIMPFKKEFKEINYSFDYNEINYQEIHKNAIEKQTEQILNMKFNTKDTNVILDENYNITDIKSVHQDKIKEYLGI